MFNQGIARKMVGSFKFHTSHIWPQGMDTVYRTMIVEVVITNSVYVVRLMKERYLDHLHMQSFDGR